VTNDTGSPSTYGYTQCNGNVVTSIPIAGGDSQVICAIVGTIVTGPGVIQTPLGSPCLSDGDCIG